MQCCRIGYFIEESHLRFQRQTFKRGRESYTRFDVKTKKKNSNNKPFLRRENRLLLCPNIFFSNIDRPFNIFVVILINAIEQNSFWKNFSKHFYINFRILNLFNLNIWYTGCCCIDYWLLSGLLVSRGTKMIKTISIRQWTKVISFLIIEKFMIRRYRI